MKPSSDLSPEMMGIFFVWLTEMEGSVLNHLRLTVTD